MTPRSHAKWAPRRGPATTYLWLLLALTGCGSSVPSAAEEPRARQTLDQALGSWSRGDTVETVKAARPAILVSDPRWSRGDSLRKYEVKGAGTPSGAERVYTVTLRVADAKGKETTETVAYRVGTDPILTVFRSLF